MTETGHGMQVVKVLKDHYQLDLEQLEQLLMNEDVKDLPVVVVSVAGAYRGGKSFLLNFFLRYLSAPESARYDGSWLGEESEPLLGFEWRGGIERNTTGILLWSESFINVLPNGEKVAVILMDTQGTFDSQSTTRDNSTIFALSTLLSSVQIYNLSTNIKEDDLQHLQLFTMYGKMVQEKDQGVKAFQILEFLIRDWQYPEEYEYGAEGGNLLLKKRLTISPDQHQEIKDLRTHISSCFENLLCFLLPHPGFKVLKRTYKGNIKDLEPDFRIYMQELVSSILASKKLCPKTINGQKVTAGELFTYFKTYMTLFNSDEILTPKGIMQATVEASLLTCLTAARGIYEKGMDADCGTKELAIPPGDVQDLHEKHLAAARSAFTNKRTMATQEEVDKYLNQLNTELGIRLPQYELSNLSKLQTVTKKVNDVYDQTIRNVTKDQPLCLHPKDLDALQNDAIQKALKMYDGNVKKISKKQDQKRTELTEIFAANLSKMKVTNEVSNRDAVNDLHTEYMKSMALLSVTPPLPDKDFIRGHEASLSQALTKFQDKRNRPDVYSSDAYKEDLTKKINETYLNLHAINLGNIAKENKRKEEERIKLENERMQAKREKDRVDQKLQALGQELTKTQMEKEEEEKQKNYALNRNRQLQQELAEEKNKPKCSIL